ncbi:SprT-like domain-containing protein, partial [Escherichia coli]|uniref:SprT-like domain-containing protein n=1 Tax=Escherichia coli TaxID=562 RepID=UPI003F284DB7
MAALYSRRAGALGLDTHQHIAFTTAMYEAGYPLLTAGGTAWLEKNEIRLNPVLLLENQREFIDEVVPHELAHLLVWQ